MFFTHSLWEVASNYCTISYVIMTPSVEFVLHYLLPMLVDRWWEIANASLWRVKPLLRDGFGLQRHAELHLLWPSPRGLTPRRLLPTQADIAGYGALENSEVQMTLSMGGRTNRQEFLWAKCVYGSIHTILALTKTLFCVLNQKTGKHTEHQGRFYCVYLRHC